MTDPTVVQEDAVVAPLVEAFPGVEFDYPFGQRVARVDREDLVEFVAAARDAGFTMFIDLCGVDYLHRDPRFEVVIVLLTMDPPGRLRILVGVPGDDARVPTITGVFAGANFYEREAYDMFGIVFDGHPDLTRILMPDDWVGHPLRKDEPVGAVPVQFKEANQAT